MLTIVMPMAGRGQRFADAGYQLPKPLIPVHGKPMTQLVIENLRPRRPHRFVFVVLAEHMASFGFDRHLKSWEPTAEVVPVKSVTEGAACTVLLAAEYFDNDNPLMIANCDQWVDLDVDDYLATMDGPALGGPAQADGRPPDGLIMTMWADDPKWSFVRFGPDGAITEVVEKRVVSNEATVGIYNFARGRDFARAARAMIAANLRVNNEFYVAPAYNQLLAEGQRLAVYNVGRENAGMYGLGIPADLERFLANPLSERAVAGTAGRAGCKLAAPHGLGAPRG